MASEPCRSKVSVECNCDPATVGTSTASSVSMADFTSNGDHTRALSELRFSFCYPQKQSSTTLFDVRRLSHQRQTEGIRKPRRASHVYSRIETRSAVREPNLRHGRGGRIRVLSMPSNS